MICGAILVKSVHLLIKAISLKCNVIFYGSPVILLVGENHACIYAWDIITLIKDEPGSSI